MANAHDLLMAQRAAMMGGKTLPYLRRVAYLESHGTEKINTGFYSNNTNDMILKIDYQRIGSGSNMFFGSNGNMQLHTIYASDTSRKIISVEHDVNLGPITRVDGNVVATASYHSFINLPIKLFAMSEQFVDSYFCKGRLFEAKLEIDGETKLLLIPVLDLSGRPCMYNQAPIEVPADDPSRFFYNQGTGEFTWGELDAA